MKQTLDNYDATNGNAYKIYVKNTSETAVLNVGGSDITAALISAGVLVGNAPADAIVETFGADWADVARYALEIKTNPDEAL